MLEPPSISKYQSVKILDCVLLCFIKALAGQRTISRKSPDFSEEILNDYTPTSLYLFREMI